MRRDENLNILKLYHWVIVATQLFSALTCEFCIFATDCLSLKLVTQVLGLCLRAIQLNCLSIYLKLCLFYFSGLVVISIVRNQK